MKVAKITVLKISNSMSCAVGRDQICLGATSLPLAAGRVSEALKWLIVTVLKKKTQSNPAILGL